MPRKRLRKELADDEVTFAVRIRLKKAEKSLLDGLAGRLSILSPGRSGLAQAVEVSLRAGWKWAGQGEKAPSPHSFDKDEAFANGLSIR